MIRALVQHAGDFLAGNELLAVLDADRRRLDPFERRNVPAALKSVAAIDTVVAAAAPVSTRDRFMTGAPAQIAALSGKDLRGA